MDGSGPYSAPAGVVFYAMDVDLSCLSDDDDDVIGAIDESFFEDVDDMLLHESFPSQVEKIAPRSEMNVPQASNIAEKGTSSDGGAHGGGQTVW